MTMHIIVCCEDTSMRVSSTARGDMSARTTFHRSTKGPLSITDCSADGKFIIIENTGRKVIQAWSLTQFWAIPECL